MKKNILLCTLLISFLSYFYWYEKLFKPQLLENHIKEQTVFQLNEKEFNRIEINGSLISKGQAKKIVSYLATIKKGDKVSTLDKKFGGLKVKVNGKEMRIHGLNDLTGHFYFTVDQTTYVGEFSKLFKGYFTDEKDLRKKQFSLFMDLVEKFR